MEFISENLKSILLALIALIATGVAITIRYRKNKKIDNSNKVTQRDNKVDGDMAGRDINK